MCFWPGASCCVSPALTLLLHQANLLPVYEEASRRCPSRTAGTRQERTACPPRGPTSGVVSAHWPPSRQTRRLTPLFPLAQFKSTAFPQGPARASLGTVVPEVAADPVPPREERAFETDNSQGSVKGSGTGGEGWLQEFRGRLLSQPGEEGPSVCPVHYGSPVPCTIRQKAAVLLIQIRLKCVCVCVCVYVI